MQYLHKLLVPSALGLFFYQDKSHITFYILQNHYAMWRTHTVNLYTSQRHIMIWMENAQAVNLLHKNRMEKLAYLK